MHINFILQSRYLFLAAYVCVSFLLCLLFVACSETPEKKYHRLNQQAEQYLSIKEYSKALAVWDKIPTSQRNSPEIYRKIGETNLKLGEFYKALQAFQEVLRLQPESWEIWLVAAQIHLALYEIAEAEMIWEKIQTALNTSEATIFHGDLLAAKRKFPESCREYEKVLAVDPHNLKAMARLALAHLGQNQTEIAQENINTLENIHPQSEEIRLQIANYWILRGESRKAENYFQSIIQENPENLGLHLRQAEFYLDSGQYDKTITILGNLLQKGPDNRFFKKMFIETLLLNRNLDKAGDILKDLEAGEDNDLDFSLLKGKYHLINLEYNIAVSQFQSVLEKEPNLPMAHYLLSLAYLAGGQNQLGQKSLVKCLTLNPDFSEAELALADSYYKNGDYDLALEHASRIKTREPGNFRAYLITGNIHLALKAYNKALADYQTVLSLNANLATPLYYMATALQLHEKPDEALTYYGELLKTRPVPADAALRYSSLLATEGKVEKAIQLLKDAAKEDPQNAYLHYILGECFLKTGNKDEAIAAISKALAIDPLMKSAYLKLSELYKGDNSKLEKLLLKIITEIPQSSEAYCRLAEFYYHQGALRKAIATLKEAFTVDPQNPRIASNLAWLYLEHQPEDIDEAMRLAQLAYEKLPDNAAAADTLGWVYYKKKMPTRALWLLEQAHALASDNPIVSCHLGMTQHSLGDDKKAKKNLSHALEVGLKPPLLQEAKDILKKINTN